MLNKFTTTAWKHLLKWVYKWKNAQNGEFLAFFVKKVRFRSKIFTEIFFEKLEIPYSTFYIIHAINPKFNN